MDHLVRVQVRESAQHLAHDVRDPLLAQGLRLGALDEVGDGPCATELHNEPELVVLARRDTLLDERAVVRRDVAVVRVLGVQQIISRSNTGAALWPPK